MSGRSVCVFMTTFTANINYNPTLEHSRKHTEYKDKGSFTEWKKIKECFSHSFRTIVKSISYSVHIWLFSKQLKIFWAFGLASRLTDSLTIIIWSYSIITLSRFLLFYAFSKLPDKINLQQKVDFVSYTNVHWNKTRIFSLACPLSSCQLLNNLKDN